VKRRDYEPAHNIFFFIPVLLPLPHFQRIYYMFMYCDFVLLAVHETEAYIQLSQHLLLDQSPYSGPVKLMVCML